MHLHDYTADRNKCNMIVITNATVETAAAAAFTAMAGKDDATPQTPNMTVEDQGPWLPLLRTNARQDAG
jgi:hypothetical protein